MILLYHKVYPDSPTRWWVEVDSFHRQMSEVRHRKVVYLDDYRPGDGSVVITFDGVYRNVLQYALPVLRKFGYPFEVFVTGGSIGKDNAFDAPEPPASFANLEELKQIVEAGGRLQWHTMTHASLKDATDRGKIAEELEVPENLKRLDPGGFGWFAYPHGEFNGLVVEETKKRFRGGLSCNQGDDDDIYRLNRVTVTNDTSFKKATVGVIIPSYNYGDFLVEAVESVLRQTRPVDEILISDDCSVDNTHEISAEYQRRRPELIRVNRNDSNLGVVRHFNKAVSLTTSDYICFLGADNRFRSDYIEKTAEALDSDDALAIAYTDFAFFGPRARLRYEQHAPEKRGGIKGDFYFLINFPDFTEESRALLRKMNFMHGSSLFRRKAFEEAGGYEEKEGTPEDYNLFLRMVNKGWSAKRVPGPLLEYRQHSAEQVNTRLASQAELQFYRNALAEKQRQIEERDERIKRILESSSWKLTAPLRRLMDLFRQDRKG